MVYTINERTEIIFIYGVENRCARRTVRVFNDRYDKNVSHTYVNKLVSKCLETESMHNIKCTNKRVLNEPNVVEVFGHFAVNPNYSIRQVSQLRGISKSSVHTTLKINKFYPYKMQIHQKLKEDDFNRRVEFCEKISEIINKNPNFLKNICFYDECTFFLKMV